MDEINYEWTKIYLLGQTLLELGGTQWRRLDFAGPG